MATPCDACDDACGAGPHRQGLGGGNDGGVKAVKRQFFVKEKAKEVKVDPSELCAIKWHLCAISAQELNEPVRTSMRLAA